MRLRQGQMCAEPGRQLMPVVTLHSVSWVCKTGQVGVDHRTSYCMGTWKDSRSQGGQTLVQMLLSLFLAVCDLDKSYHFPEPTINGNS